MKDKKYDAIVLGSGPAGCSAAIYLARANLDTLLISGDKRGGLLTTTTIVENYPGYEEIDGPVLMDKMIKQTQKSGATVIDGECTKFRRDNSGSYTVAVENIDLSTINYSSCAIILATGATPRKLPIPDLIALENMGVSYCATCDGPLYKEANNIFVVGGGDSAATSALYLSRLAKKVTLLIRKSSFRNNNYLTDQVSNSDNIEVKYNTEIEAVSVDEDKNFNGLVIVDNTNGSKENVKGSAVFINIGHVVKRDIFPDNIETLEDGHLNIDYTWLYSEEEKKLIAYRLDQYAQLTSHEDYVVDLNNKKLSKIYRYINGKNYLSFCTSMPGVFAIGDVVDPLYQQAVIGAGMGAAAALSAVSYICFVKDKVLL